MFSEQKYEIIRQRVLDNIAIQINKTEGSFTSNMVSPTIEEISKVYISMGDIMSLGFIADTFDTYLDKRIEEFGVYRKIGTKANGSVKVVGINGTTISNGTILDSNGLKYVVLNDIVLPTEDILYLEAMEVGVKYNLPINTNFTLMEENNNITSLTAIENFKLGLDRETDEELRKRFEKVVNNPSTSGNPAHYEEWALEVDGVSRALVYPLWDKSNGMNGNGTVKVMCVGSDNKPVSSEITDNVKAHINSVKPIGCTLTVTTPSLLDITIKASIELKAGYTIEEVTIDFEASLNNYLKSITDELVYSKVYGLIVNLLGVGDINSLTINNSTSNIAIAEDKIINVLAIELSEVV